MKKIYFLAFLFLCTFLTIGTNTAWGETVTVEQNSFSKISGIVNNDVNISYIAEQGKAANEPIANSGVIRVYQNGGLFTISANNGVTISQVILGSAMKTSVVYSIDGGTDSSAKSITAKGKLTISNLSATKIKFTCKGTDKNSRLYVNYISVTYETGGSTPTYTVTYDANGGAVSPASDSYTNTPINLPTPTIEGCYLFDGWYTAKTGGTKVQSPYTPTANITLYAQWTASTATYMAMINQPDATTNCRVKISKDGTTGVEDYYDDIACGTTIHLLGTPSNGYKGLTYTAKDDNNNNVTITPNGLNNASFVMPASSVEITATPIPCDAMDAPVVTYTSASNALTFSWKPITGATNYNLYLFYNADGSSHSNDATANTTECSYTFSNLEKGHTYAYIIQAQSAISTCHTETNGTATVVKPYTIAWSTPTGKTTTQVTPGDKVVLPTTDPASCSSTYTNFVGWFTEAAGSESNPSTAKPATQVTAATIPTGDATYYAVFSDATGDGTTTVFSETFNKANGTGGNDNQWSGNNIATTDWDVAQCDNTSGWTVSNVNFANACIKVGSGSKKGSVQTSSITISGNATITFLAGAWDGKDEKTTLNISATNGKLSQTSVTMKKGEWTPYTITLSDVTSATTQLTFAAVNTAKNRFFLDEIKVVVSSTTPATGYISFCTPYIKGTDDITVTSAKGIWVEAVTPLNITATNLDKNADGANVTITATSLTNGFTLKTQDTNDNKSVTLVTGYSNSTYNANLTVVYSPTADNIIEEGKIALRVCSTNGTTTYATDTIIVRGRSLPAEFVLAAETTNGWVALPADLGTSSTDAVKKPYTISVDDDAAPTKATLAPQSALYSAAMRSADNTIPTGLRFAAGGNYLQGSQSEGETKVWLSSNDNKQMQSWELHSSDLTDYFVRLRAAEEGRYLSYNATQGKIANYKQDSRLRILPVENTCVRYDAPNIRVHALISTSVTFVWEAIAGVTDYEYSLDNEQTWQTCSGSETLGTEVKWTLANLTSETKYTVYIRAKVADGKSNCSVSDSETFTTPTCDDVPVDLWVSPTANAATIMWSAKAPTATVKIYADEQGTKLVKETTNATTPCKITGLEQNTDYYYQVLADGSCASAIAHFKTESNEVSIVEWKKDALIVDLNTEVTDADEVSILVENQHTHGTNNQNIADDLFFSKYYEATGNVKLVAIYNGTKDTLPLTNVQIKIGNTTWDKTIQMSDYGKYKSAHIAPDEEIILWRKGTTSVDKEISDCVAGKMNIKIMNENDNVVFGGKASIGLFRTDTLIDMIGAGTNDLPKEGTIKPSWGDDPGWLGSGYDIENPSTEIELSTNRCLLVRGNKVKSGRNAVLNNTTTFATFTKDEWLGRQVSKYKEDGTDDKGKESSCNGFAYVADFNYNDYYTTYDSIANLEIKGNRNEDGTYTIPIPKLDTMACTNLRLQLKKKGAIQATREEKVPIIIYTTTDTKNSTFFGGKLTDEICKTCDVVVRDNAQLSHIAGGKQQFRDMYVYTGSSLKIPAEQTMSLDKVRMFATNDNVSYAIVNNSNDAAAAISVKEVSHVKRIDGRYWYPFSLPYDCNIADIDQLNGQPLGVYGTDWGIKYYDGQRRQSDGNSTTHYGEVSKYWTMMPKDGQLKAYTGYIIGLFVPAADEPLMKSVNFPPATESAYTEDASSKTTPITNWPDNLTAKPRHHGWNFVGSPYISLFGSNNLGEGLYNTQVQMGWTDALGNQKDNDKIYVSIPDGGNTNTYTQALASGVTIKPFSAYFVQAIDPDNGQSNTLNLTYRKGPRSLPKWAPARTAKTDVLILTELDITNGALGDNTGVLVSNVYSAEYEIGDDLTKMYAAAQKPQLYTIDAHNDKMAYQALPDVLAHAILLGIYVPQAGNYTLSLNRYVSRLEAAEAVYLLHNGAVVANLLLSDYTVAASAKGTISGYSLDIRRAPEVVTDIVPAAGDAPYIIARDGVLAIANLPADAVVQVYDVLGHRLLQADTHAAGTLQVPVPQTGVYTVVITTADGQQVLKTLLR